MAYGLPPDIYSAAAGRRVAPNRRLFACSANTLLNHKHARNNRDVLR